METLDSMVLQSFLRDSGREVESLRMENAKLRERLERLKVFEDEDNWQPRTDYYAGENIHIFYPENLEASRKPWDFARGKIGGQEEKKA